MNVYKRILFYLKPYWGRLGLSVLCSVFFSLFSGISLYLTIPLLETLFGGGTAASTAISSPAASIVPDWINAARVSLSQAFQQLVFRPDPASSLLNICIIIVVAFFIKNF